MVPDLRRESIVNYIAECDVAYMKDLVGELGISLSTIRRDLQALQKEGGSQNKAINHHWIKVDARGGWFCRLCGVFIYFIGDTRY